MEGSESEAAFEAAGLNPQRFVNEVINSAHDLLDGAFHFCHQQASEITGAAADRSDELSRGVAFIQNLVQTVLEERMDKWENYCLRHCFSVPEGFVLPNDNDLSDSGQLVQVGPHDAELDSQLDSLRDRIAAVGKEATELQQEIDVLEKQSTLSSSYDVFIAEALHLYVDNSVCDMSQDIGKHASKLFSKLEELKTKRKEGMEFERNGKMYKQCKKQHVVHDYSLEDIQDVLTNLKNT